MTPSSSPPLVVRFGEPERPRWPLLAAGLALAACLGLGAGYAAFGHEEAPVPANRSVVVVRPTPNVLVAVRELARLETVTFHMERVIDLADKQQHLFGLVEAEDAILLVAVGDVVAGVDLAMLAPSDVTVSADGKSARVVLPAPQVFSTRLDNEHTYVHTRTTGLLAKRQESLETRARAEAERSLGDAALDQGILERAKRPASQTIERMLRALGFEQVTIEWKAP